MTYLAICRQSHEVKLEYFENGAAAVASLS